MKTALVGSGIASILALSCNDPAAPPITGRWATLGMEFVQTPLANQLHVACNQLIRTPRAPFGLDQRHVRITGTLRSGLAYYDFTFDGQILGDTLRATMTVSGGADPSSRDVVLTVDGDPQFAGLACAG